MLSFNLSFQSLPNFFYERVEASPLKDAKLIHVDHETKRRLGLDPLSDEELLRWLNSETRLVGDQRIASRYAGHRFGVWAGQLGDGRAISLGEVLTDDATHNSSRLEIQTKGSGQTPFSRRGDGRAVVRSSVREYLCSIAMKGLGIPTTDVLALMVGADAVYREEVEQSAIVTRVAESFIRFGHFEMAYHFNKTEELQALIDYTRINFFKSSTVEAMLETIVDRTAYLIAKWQSVGFCHGVMNTDNMSILGLTLDYGPYGFLEDTDINHICNHSDHEGRYAFLRQPQIAYWNLEKLFVCFLNHLDRERLAEILGRYPAAFEKHYEQVCRDKLGLIQTRVGDADLFGRLMLILSENRIDYTYFFRSLCDYKTGELSSMNQPTFKTNENLMHWFKSYDERLILENSVDEKRSVFMKKKNPKYVLRNYIAQEIINDVNQNQLKSLNEWIMILKSPFDEHESYSMYARPTPDHLKNFVISCSS